MQLSLNEDPQQLDDAQLAAELQRQEYQTQHPVTAGGPANRRLEWYSSANYMCDQSNLICYSFCVVISISICDILCYHSHSQTTHLSIHPFIALCNTYSLSDCILSFFGQFVWITYLIITIWTWNNIVLTTENALQMKLIQKKCIEVQLWILPISGTVCVAAVAVSSALCHKVLNKPIFSDTKSIFILSDSALCS